MKRIKKYLFLFLIFIILLPLGFFLFTDGGRALGMILIGAIIHPLKLESAAKKCNENVYTKNTKFRPDEDLAYIENYSLSYSNSPKGIKTALADLEFIKDIQQYERRATVTTIQTGTIFKIISCQTYHTGILGIGYSYIIQDSSGKLSHSSPNILLKVEFIENPHLSLLKEVKNRDIEKVKLLIKQGADPNVWIPYFSALNFARDQNNKDIYSILLEALETYPRGEIK